MPKIRYFVSFLIILILTCVWLASQTIRSDELEPAASDDPASVIIIANRASPPEANTAHQGASIFVARHYAKARAIPLENLLIVDTSVDETIEWSEFLDQIRSPLKDLLKEKEPGAIRYIVPVYGIPLRIKSLPEPPPGRFTKSGFSLDMYLASTFSGDDRAWIENPYRASSVVLERSRFLNASRNLKWPLLLVTRLDGSSAADVVRLIDRTISAEKDLDPSDGIGYFDFRGLGHSCGSYCDADIRIRQAFLECQRLGFRCILNDQSETSQMIRSAPDTLWAWGWYSPHRISGEYTFLPGAVGAQLTSFSAATIRQPSAGGWVHHWLASGITATWGATAEPFVDGYAQGDVLFANFWRGFNFAESAYLSTPQLNWMMVFVGDPLYSPYKLRSKDRRRPIIDKVSVERLTDGLLVRWRTDERADTEILSVAEKGDTAAPIFYDRGLTESHFARIRLADLLNTSQFEIRATDPWGNSTSHRVTP